MARIALIILLSFCLVLTGCTTIRYAPVPAASGTLTGTLKVGDIIHVTQRSGETRRLKLRVVAADTLTGRDLDAKGPATNVQIAVADIQSLQVQKASWGRGVLLGLGVVAAVFVALVLGVAIKCGYISGEDKCSD